MRLSRLWLVLLLVVGFCFAAPQTDNSISFQGYLTDISDYDYNGNVSMGFKFFNHPTATVNANEIISTTFNDSSTRNVRNVSVLNGNYTTKIEFFDEEITLLNAAGDVWVEVYVLQGQGHTYDEVMTTNNKLLPRIQLNAVPYALAVRGVYYDALNDIVKIGENFQAMTANVDVTTTNRDATHPTGLNDFTRLANDTRRGGMVIQGQVRIGNINAPAAPYDNAALYVNDAENDGKTVDVVGNVYIQNGRVSANQVFGAVWN